mmetsp:Transcript_16979/g.43798  ORF Transcript_16979/g.43798 Transcript_16979/m.43798 type:complete len:159 (+) Transcript_16979:64-540(+)
MAALASPSLRELLCFAAGAAAAVAVIVTRRRQERKRLGKPRLLPLPTRVVELEDGIFTIDEHCGNATNGDAGLSIAVVRTRQKTQEPAQTPQFDEYIMVLEGEVLISVDGEDRPSLSASSGRTLWLPKGHRYEYFFPGPCKYVPVCLPAFHPSLTDRK